MVLTESDYKESLGDLDWNFHNSKTETIHSIHPYPAKFIPEIPRALIKNLPIPRNSIILDPFCGSGVTLVEAQKAGIESIGVDLNPIACLLSEVKTKQLNINFLDEVQEIIVNCNSFKGRSLIPEIPNLNHWFKKEIQRSLSVLLNEINKVDNENILNALKFCFSSIIVKVSNQDSDTRYAAIDKQWKKEDVFSLFKQSAERLWKAKTSYNESIQSRVINKNSLLLDKSDFPANVGMVITSPPYPNAYEYWLYHKYRMWWLGYDPIEVKKSEIGARAHYFKKNHQTVNDFVDQMEQLFSYLWDVCVNNAFICLVIGQSKIHGEIIENEKLIAKIGQKMNFKYLTTLERVINPSRKSFNLSHARIKNEFIVILKKNAP